MESSLNQAINIGWELTLLFEPLDQVGFVILPKPEAELNAFEP